MAPTILLIPGYWEGPTVFDQVRQHLHAAGFPTKTGLLVSTGHISPGNPTMADDIEGIRQSVVELVEKEEKEVVLVLHSVAGILGSNAIEGLELSKRKAAGKAGGVMKIVFLAAGVAPEGFEHSPPPFVEVKGGAIYCKDMKEAMFHDVPDADKWLEVMRPQPEDWHGSVTYCGWRHVPSTYVIAEQDRIIGANLQQDWAGMIGSKIIRTESGHMLILVKPEEVAKAIID